MPECLEEFTENLKDEMVLASRGTPASTSQDSDLERHTKVVSRKHSIFAHFPNNINSEMCKRTKMTRGLLAEDALVMQYLVQKTLTGQQQITMFSVKGVNLEKIIDFSFVVQDLANHLIQSAPCEIKTSQATNRILRKFLEPSEKPKVIFSDIFWNLAKPVKIYHGIIVHQRVTDLRRMVLLREPQAKLKEVSAVMLQSGMDGECCADSMEYYPISVTDQSRLHPFGKKVLPGLFLGCPLYAGWNSEG